MFHISKKKSGTASPDTASPKTNPLQLDSSTGAAAASSNSTSMPPPISTNKLHSLGRAKSRETSSASTSRTSSPSPADDPSLVHNQPKRTSSFRSLGLSSLGSGLTKAAGEVVHGIGKSSKEKEKVEAGASSVPTTPPVNGGPFNFNGGSDGVMITPDPSHLADFSLSLSELVNKAFAPCSTGSSASNGILPTGVTSAVGGGNASSSVKTKKRHAAPPLSSIQYEGRRLPERSRVVEISELITKELMYASSVDSYLLRAVSRQALKALSLFSNRIDGLLVPLSRDNGAIRIPSNAKEGANLPNALEFNLGLVTLEWIVEDALERCLDGRMEADLGLDTGMPSFVSEILTPVRQKMERTILHVIQPILTGVKASLTSCINQAVPEPFAANISSGLGSNSPHRSPETLSPTIPPTSSNGHAALPTPTKEGGASSLLGRSDYSISQSSPAWLKELEARLEGARALLVPRIEERCGQDGEGWFISVVIHLIWKGLLVLSSRSSEPFGSKCYLSSLAIGAASASSSERTLGRPFGLAKEGASSSRAPSPAQLSSAIKAVSLGGKKVGSNRDSSLPPSGRSTPSASISEGSAASSIPINQASTNPTRTCPSRSTAQQISELQTFEKLVCRFARGFISSPSNTGSLRGRLGNPLSNRNTSSGVMVDGEESDSESSSDDEEDELARAALAEAVQAVRSTILALQHIDTIPTFTLNALCRSRGCPPGLSTCEGIPNGSGFITPSVSGSTSPNAGSAPLHNVASSSAAANATVPVEVLKAFKAIPPLILLHLVYARLPRSSRPTSASVSSEERNLNRSPGLQVPSPPELFGYSWQEYEKAIAGFNGGETWAGALVNGWTDSLQTEWTALLEREKKLKVKEEARVEERKAINRDSAAAGSQAAREADLPPSGHAIESGEEAAPAQMQRSMSVASSDSETSLPEAMTRSAPTLEKERATTARGSESPSSDPLDASPPSTSHGRIQTSSGAAGESLGAARDALLQRQALTAGLLNSSGAPEGHQLNSRSSTAESEVAGSSSSPLSSPGITGTTSNNSSSSASKPRFWRSTSSQRTFHLPSLSRTASPRGRGSEADLNVAEDPHHHHHSASNSIPTEINQFGNGNQASLMLGPNGEWIQIDQEDKVLLKQREILNLERFGLILFKKTLAAVGKGVNGRESSI